MKYIRKFSTQSDRDAYMASGQVLDVPYMHLVESTGEVMFSGPEVDVPLYIRALENLTVRFYNPYEYSKDCVTWTTATSSTSIPLIAGERVFFRASGLTASSSSGIGTFAITNGKCNVGGNVMSMVYGADFKGQTEITQTYQFCRLFSASMSDANIVDASGLALPATTLASNCYYYMFEDQQKLIGPPALPATTLASYSYSYMFCGCTSLTSTPLLPATTLALRCYENMFRDCTSLVTAPPLPATTLANYCYSNMFNGCTSLANVPPLPATTLATYCYSNMFYGCTSLVNAPTLPATTLASNCYSYMFRDCTSLVTAPPLPATTLATYCYSYMFYGCTALVNAPTLPATILATYCYQYMFRGCTSLVNAPALPATTLANYCYSGMFYGCTSLTSAPLLLAETLVSNCYGNMFRLCSNLNYIKAMFTTKPSSSYTSAWVDGVSPSGTFVKNSAATWDVVGTSGIPSSWTVETADA